MSWSQMRGESTHGCMAWKLSRTLVFGGSTWNSNQIGEEKEELLESTIWSDRICFLSIKCQQT